MVHKSRIDFLGRLYTIKFRIMGLVSIRAILAIRTLCMGFSQPSQGFSRKD